MAKLSPDAQRVLRAVKGPDRSAQLTEIKTNLPQLSEEDISKAIDELVDAGLACTDPGKGEPQVILTSQG